MRAEEIDADRPAAPRIGPGLINVYLLEESAGVTIVDAGAPGYWRELPSELSAMGRTLHDVRAVVLTHAHSDHVGFADRIAPSAGRRCASTSSMPRGRAAR